MVSHIGSARAAVVAGAIVHVTASRDLVRVRVRVRIRVRAGVRVRVRVRVVKQGRDARLHAVGGRGVYSANGILCAY